MPEPDGTSSGFWAARGFPGCWVPGAVTAAARATLAPAGGVFAFAGCRRALLGQRGGKGTEVRRDLIEDRACAAEVMALWKNAPSVVRELDHTFCHHPFLAAASRQAAECRGAS